MDSNFFTDSLFNYLNHFWVSLESSKSCLTIHVYCKCIFYLSMNSQLHYYHPQMKFGKVVFLHLSVSHSVHGGSTWAGTTPGQVTHGQVHPWAGTPSWAGTPPQAGTTPGSHSVHRGSTWAGTPPGQTKFVKVMFLHLSVSHSVHRGSTWVGTSPGQVQPLRQVHPPGRYTPRQSFCSQGEYLGRYPPGQVHTPRQVHTSLGRYPPPPATVHAGIRLTSGLYASHWNAFLCIVQMSILPIHA